MSVNEEKHVIDLLPAYVLDSLSDDETCQVAEHLAICPDCQAELSRLQQVADELPLALAQTTPPSALKDKLMERIHAGQMGSTITPQLTAWQKLAAIFKMPLPALGLALIVFLALGNILLWRQLSFINSQTSNSMRVIALADTQYSSGAVGELIMDPRGSYGSLVVSNLAVLNQDQQYQIWLIKGTTRTSGGVFSVNSDGYGSMEIMAPLALTQYDSIGVTIEPFGGSPGPTGEKVLGGDIPR